MLYSIN